jgi:tRNA(Arg) A34 adenosine deaminase TadA
MVMGDLDRLKVVDPAWREAFGLAWESWCAGSMGIGAVLVREDGQVVSRGRNRVLEASGSGNIAGTLLAHAEMVAFAGLGLSTAEGLSLYTTVEPCLMCASTAVAMRLARVSFAASDPVFEGLDEALASHSYSQGRMPSREKLADPILVSFAATLPLAHRVWSRPGRPPRDEWVRKHQALWDVANRLIDEGILVELRNVAARRGRGGRAADALARRGIAIGPVQACDGSVVTRTDMQRVVGAGLSRRPVDMAWDCPSPPGPRAPPDRTRSSADARSPSGCSTCRRHPRSPGWGASRRGHGPERSRRERPSRRASCCWLLQGGPVR